jgi:hypothetical protein
MSRDFAVAFGIGLAVIALAIGAVFYMQRGDVIELPGKILKVRTARLDENSTIAILDFRITNPSDVLLEVRQVQVEMEDKEGKSYLGDVASEGDTKRVFEAMPILGPKFLETLSMRQRIKPHVSEDHMVAVRFAAPLEQIDGRKRFILHIEEIDGKTFEYPER